MTRVAVLVYEGVSLFEVSCALELFAIPRPEFTPWYECQVISFEGEWVTTNAGVRLSAQPYTSLDEIDLIIVPAWFTDGRAVPPKMQAALLDCYQRQARIISFCSGAFLLASIGFLDGLSATTHWRYAQQFKSMFPKVQYASDVLYVYDGRLGCSAGSAAAIDLGLEIIRLDHGHAVASSVAKRLVLAMQRKGSQAQYADRVPLCTTERLLEALNWAMKYLHTGITVDQMAAQANMSRRSFNRRFKDSQQMTPSSWLTQQKLDRARELLETTRLDIDRVALHAGFSSAMTLRHHFRSLYKSTPMHYRQQFLEERQIRSKVAAPLSSVPG
jgi:AraC family transcriptional activator FtrA